MKSQMPEVRTTTATRAASRVALALCLSGAACLFGGGEPEPSTTVSVAPSLESTAPPDEPPVRAEIEPESTPETSESNGAVASDGAISESQGEGGVPDSAASEPGTAASEQAAPSEQATPSDSAGSGEPEVPGPPRSIKVLQRVDENGVTHYVIQPADDSSGDAGVDREPADDLVAVSSPPSAAPQTEAQPEAASANDASEPEPSPIYSATADESATQAAVRDLEARIRQDREAIKNLITDPGAVNPAEDPRLREIADRLPRLQAELDALRNERQP